MILRWALALGLLFTFLPAPARAQPLEDQLRFLEATRSDAERQLREKRRSIASNEDFLRERRAQVREAGDGMGGVLVKRMNQPMIDSGERIRAALAEDARLLEERLDSLDGQLKAQRRKIADFREEQRRRDDQAALEARLKAEAAARLEADRIAEERRVAWEEARAKRQWTLIAVVGGMFVALFGLYFALRAVGVTASLSEWSRSYYWLTRAAVVLTLALFFLTAVETIFGALSIPDWMRRPLAELLDKASDAIDPEAQADAK